MKSQLIETFDTRLCGCYVDHDYWHSCSVPNIPLKLETTFCTSSDSSVFEFLISDLNSICARWDTMREERGDASSIYQDNAIGYVWRIISVVLIDFVLTRCLLSFTFTRQWWCMEDVFIYTLLRSAANFNHDLCTPLRWEHSLGWEDGVHYSLQVSIWLGLSTPLTSIGPQLAESDNPNTSIVFEEIHQNLHSPLNREVYDAKEALVWMRNWGPIGRVKGTDWGPRTVINNVHLSS